MDREDILSSLCYYDDRNPMKGSLYYDAENRPEECSCDNCFYGRHELAEELLKYMEEDVTT